MTRRLLVLGGTREAREIATALAGDTAWRVVVSLAGATKEPAPLPVEIRVGGFGGADGLARHLGENKVEAVVDATHPFARQMSANAVTACTQTEVPLLRIERPAWTRPAAAEWIVVADLDEAARILPSGARVFLTVGADSLEPFACRDDVWFLVRTMERRPDGLPLPRGKLVVGPPSQSPEEEARLMRAHRVTRLVTKNAGGTAFAKLAAAADLEIPAIVIDRPRLPPAETVADAAGALDWLRRLEG